MCTYFYIKFNNNPPTLYTYNLYKQFLDNEEGTEANHNNEEESEGNYLYIILYIHIYPKNFDSTSSLTTLFNFLDNGATNDSYTYSENSEDDGDGPKSPLAKTAPIYSKQRCHVESIISTLCNIIFSYIY